MPKADEIDIVDLDALDIATAITACDWSAPSIGNKEILKAAVAMLRSQAKELSRLRSLSPCDGWKLVPVEPTEEMADAYARYSEPDSIMERDQRMVMAYNAWTVLLSASPYPPIKDKV